MLAASTLLAVSTVDITNFANNNHTEAEKYEFILNHPSPDSSFRFPKQKDGRSFQRQWMTHFPWLKYSKQENGGYCLPCVMFVKKYDFPLALYTHCSSHRLNLAVVSSLKESNVRNMIGVLNRVSIFFSAHPKRQRKLEEAIDKTQPEAKVHKLKDLCRTRWIERIDALD